MADGKLLYAGLDFSTIDLAINGRPIVSDAAVSCSSFTITQSTEPDFPIATERARALSAWIKGSKFDPQQFIFGTTPDGSMVRVARVVGVGTAACWADIAPELAEIECVVDYLLTRMDAEDLHQVDEQRRLEWPIEDGWGIALQAMVGNKNVLLLRGGQFGHAGRKIFQIEAPPTALGSIRRTQDLALPDLRTGGIDWAEDRLTIAGVPFNFLERIPPVGAPRALDVEQARQAIEAADRAFDLS